MVGALHRKRRRSHRKTIHSKQMYTVMELPVERFSQGRFHFHILNTRGVNSCKQLGKEKDHLYHMIAQHIWYI
jgi:hypothetical protein